MKHIYLWLAVICLSMPHSVSAFETKAEFAILYDYNTKTILFEKNADELMGPSSMTKLMTSYLLFDALKRGDYSLEDEFHVSETAWRKGGSKMFVKEGDDVKVEDLLRGIVIQSGNDACIVVAEALAGSEEAFAEEMTFKAKQIGMQDSHFKNASGWPDPDHVMTARDLKTLGVRLYEDFPEYYKYFSEKEFTYADIRQYNRNRLLSRNVGVDGLKTGHTKANGYGITVSAEQEDRRLFLVVNGLRSVKDRNKEAERLIRYGFREFDIKTPVDPGQSLVEVPVWMGASSDIALVAQESIEYIEKRRAKESEKAKLKVTYKTPLIAPLSKEDQVGKLEVLYDGEVRRTIPLYPEEDVEKLPYFQRKLKQLTSMFVGSSS